MSDPITATITVISEHPQATAAIASIYGIAKPFLSKVLGPAADEMGEIGRDYIKGWRAKNGNQLLAGADKLLTDVGRNPQPVPLRTLFPLLDAASLEPDPTLAEQWAALLANAADPAQRVAVRPGFIDVLRQLTPVDARVLTLIYKQSAVNFTDPDYEFQVVATNGFTEQLDVTYAQLVLSIDELLRLRLCEPNGGSHVKMINPAEQMRVVDAVFPTAFGTEFLRAVTPPAPGGAFS